MRLLSPCLVNSLGGGQASGMNRLGEAGDGFGDDLGAVGANRQSLAGQNPILFAADAAGPW